MRAYLVKRFLMTIVVLLLQLVVIVFVVMGLSMLHREKRLLDRLERAGSGQDSSDPSDSVDWE